MGKRAQSLRVYFIVTILSGGNPCYFRPLCLLSVVAENSQKEEKEVNEVQI